MFFKEHAVPHFHARYGGQVAVFTVESFERLRGELPRRAERLVREWADLHRDELLRKLGACASGQGARGDRTAGMSDIHDIVEVEVAGDHALRVIFDDGAVRDVNLEGQLDGPVFEPLRDPELFAQVRVDSESGTVTWPTGADLDPIVIYEGLPPLNARVVREAAA
jgi:hypothetical protein